MLIEIWNLVFIGGAIIGGYIAINFLGSPEPVQIAQSTQDYLQTIGIQVPQTLAEGNGYVPEEIFGNPFSAMNLMLLTVGGF